MPIKTANHNKVSQAPFVQALGPADDTRDELKRPNMAATTGLMPNGWKIHMNTVMPIVMTTMSSSWLSGPSSFNSQRLAPAPPGCFAPSVEFAHQERGRATDDGRDARRLEPGEPRGGDDDAERRRDLERQQALRGASCTSHSSVRSIEAAFAIQNAPSFRDVGPGSEPACLAND